MSTSVSGHKFIVLDGMRGIAAILVMLSHTTPGLETVVNTSVDFFFILSGFVLTHGYGELLAEKNGRRSFFVGRLIRLYPLYAAGTALGVLAGAAFVVLHVFEWWTPQAFFFALVAAPFFLPVPLEWSFPFNPPAWSLFFELVANAIFLLLGWRRIPAIAIVVICAPLLLWSMSVRPDGGGWNWDSLLDGFPRVLYSFFLGVLLYRFWHEGLGPRHAIPCAILLPIVTLVLLFTPISTPAYLAFLVLVLQPLFIWWGANADAGGRAEKMLIWLGMISYGIYILHLPILYIFEIMVRALFLDWDNNASQQWYSVLAVVPLSLLAAHWLTRYFDMPVRNWLKERLIGPKLRFRAESS